MSPRDRLRWTSVTPLDPTKTAEIQAHLDDLTKPRGSLGHLESLGLQLALIAGTTRPPDPDAYLLTFAGDHGITAHGVSAYPSEVTPQMVANIAAGGAASSVLCRALGIVHKVIDVGVAVPCRGEGIVQRNVCRGTADPLAGPAMTRAQAEASIAAGIDEVDVLPGQRFSLLCVGEMGIGNSAIAALITSALTGLDPNSTVGPGTGLAGDALAHKKDVVRRVLAARTPDKGDPIGVLAAVGGAEIGAMAGAMIAGASRRWAVVIDGYIAGAAALVAMALAPAVRDYLIASHCSAEPGAAAVLETLRTPPLLDLRMRLGEGTGAALAVPILRSACAILRETATFSGAGVSEKVR
jgi:nicotinate-nucleotide--dimethylbenzimidazole phosphoribosyltransferase